MIVAETLIWPLELISSDPLQWGRDLIVAETPFVVGRNHVSKFASMGPRLDSRGNKWKKRKTNATTMLQWGRDLIVAETKRVLRILAEAGEASMGPRLDSRGNSAIRCVFPPRRRMLQWGRDLIVAETATCPTCHRAKRHRFNGAAT